MATCSTSPRTAATSILLPEWSIAYANTDQPRPHQALTRGAYYNGSCSTGIRSATSPMSRIDTDNSARLVRRRGQADRVRRLRRGRPRQRPGRRRAEDSASDSNLRTRTSTESSTARSARSSILSRSTRRKLRGQPAQLVRCLPPRHVHRRPEHGEPGAQRRQETRRRAPSARRPPTARRPLARTPRPCATRAPETTPAATACMPSTATTRTRS